MKKVAFIIVLVMLTSVFSCKKDGSLSTDQIVSGLVELLNVGSTNATTQGSQANGFLSNSLIKILFPQSAEFVDVALRNGGYGSKSDTLIYHLNRTAESASSHALPIFKNAISSMSIIDAIGILYGGDYAATNYLKEKSYSQIVSTFKTDVDASSSTLNSAWTDCKDTYNALPITHQTINTDISQYTTEKSVDGLFTLLGIEEAKIRHDPNAQVSDILKTVFGG
ncbi:MAG: DUF4197 domain-containing protein [Bacteroidota bacterium]